MTCITKFIIRDEYLPKGDGFMFTITADPIQQRLNITINDFYDEEDLKSICFMINGELNKLKNGWSAAVDLRGMRVLEQKLTKYIKRIQYTFLAHNVARVATLVDNVILKMQIQRIGNETGCNDITRRFNNEEAWLTYLSTPPEINRSRSSTL